jgi:hypothetical protein
MIRYSQFNDFKPLKDEVPYFPITEARNIAGRARSLLRINKRTEDDVQAIATDASQIMEAYFDHEKEAKLEEIQREKRWDLLDGDEDGNFLSFKSEAFDEFDIRTSDNTPTIDALIEGIDYCFDPAGVEVKDAEPYEYFAVLALWFIADYLEDLETKFEFKKLKRVKRIHKKYTAEEILQFGQKIFEAFESVAHAEQLRAIKRVEEKYESKIQKILDEKSRISKSASETMSKEVRREMDEEYKKERREHAKKMAAISKKPRNASLDAALAKWDREPALQALSAAKAGAKLSTWLGTQDLEFFEPRTVAEWVSAHKKKIKAGS